MEALSIIRFKASETLLGIETFQETGEKAHCIRFKASETLLGIETPLPVEAIAEATIQSLWNPFRDWNFKLRKDKAALVMRIQSLWNPFRDWNGLFPYPVVATQPIQSLWNPFRDWNISIPKGDAK